MQCGFFNSFPKQILCQFSYFSVQNEFFILQIDFFLFSFTTNIHDDASVFFLISSTRFDLHYGNVLLFVFDKNEIQKN